MNKIVGINIVLWWGVILLSGCVAKSPKTNISVVNKNSEVLATSTSNTLDGVAKMERCRRELDALKKINSQAYEKRKQDFDQMLFNAGLYTGIRDEVTTYTQGVVDAYYRYKSDKLCADISNDVLNGLAK